MHASPIPRVRSDCGEPKTVVHWLPSSLAHPAVRPGPPRSGMTLKSSSQVDLPPRPDSGTATRASVSAEAVGALNGIALTEAMLINAITATGKYQLIEKLERRPFYHRPDGTVTKTALFVDVETTGTEDTDAIIQLAVVPFEFCPQTGRIFAVGACEAWYEDPDRPIPSEVTRLTGITNAEVAGKRIDEGRVRALLDSAVLVVAHKATFDRAMLERRLPEFVSKYWACSCEDVPWLAEGLQSAKLEWLAYKVCRMYYEAHRADADCLMAIHLLASTLPSGVLAMQALLSAARQRTIRVWAVRSDKSTKDRLKRRGYRWQSENDGRSVAWWRDVPESQLDAEAEWLAEHVYGGPPRHKLQRVDGRTRYSPRVAKLDYLEAS
jgi:DNA polymerase III subunit epsilon